MNPSGLALDEFHKGLDELCHVSRIHFGELYRICFQDDDIREASQSTEISPERRKELERMRLSSYAADWDSPDVAGLGILDAMESFSSFRTLGDVEFCLKLCRESCGYSEATSVCRKAIDAFEQELQSLHRQLRVRFLTWPRPEMSVIMRPIERMVRLLMERKLNDIVDETSAPPQYAENPGLDNRHGDQQKSTAAAVAGLGQINSVETPVVVQSAAPAPLLPDRTHSECFSSVRWDGEKFIFTPAQAAVVKCLWDAMEKGNPVISEILLLEKAGTAGSALRNLFRTSGRNHSAWGMMIIKAGKNLFQLSPSKSESHT